MGTKLSVNVNKIATLRNTRALGIPSVVNLSRIALEAGAAGITVHPRPDARHIRGHDVTEIARLLREFPGREFNIEGNPFYDFMPFIRAVKPTQCTLVPDSPEAFTSNHGWHLNGTAAEGAKTSERLRPLIGEMKELGCRVSLFMDADSPDIELAKEMGADRVELYTEPFAASFLMGAEELEKSLALYAGAAKQAGACGLEVNAGHDLNLENLPIFVKRVPGVAEVSIGHALIADALEFGMHETIKKYLRACGQ